MVAGILSFFFPASLLISYTWATLIGLSRVMLKVHFLSDILAGMLLGSFIASVTLSGLLSLSILG